MKEQTIIGAGLSGLVAGTILARKGYRVLIRERRPEPGGAVTMGDLHEEVYLAGDGTPMDLVAMERYLGIDISPAAVPLPVVRAHVYGKTFEVGFAPGVDAFLFERGPRPSSLDSHLYRVAEEAGVGFSFNDTVNQEDFPRLPPGTIVATGLFPEALPGMGLPELPLYGYIASGETERQDTAAALYFDEFTRDYAFYTRLAGVHAAVLFSRQWHFKDGARDAFREALARDEGAEFEEWFDVNVGSVIHRGFGAPRLFWRDRVLAGTLAGMQDPFLFFGVHGALLCGKIAALAVEEPVIAEREFRRINATYPFFFAQSYFHRYCPVPILRPLLWLAFRLYPGVARLLGKRLFVLVPGYGRI